QGRMLPGFALFHPFVVFQVRVGNLALQDPCAGHQDGIVLPLAQGIGLGGFALSVLQVAAVEVEKSAVFVNAADAVVMVVMPVDGLGLLEVGEGIAAVALVFVAKASQATTGLRLGFGFTTTDLVLTAALGLLIDLPADLQGDESLHISDVGKGAGKVAMLR